MAEQISIQERAARILRANDRGGYTIPTGGLYPFQWNWDSAITALGWATFDEPRAWLEIEMLFRGQWQNGLLPHIVFHEVDDDYFPGPSQWGVAHEPPTSSITQPPLLASVARRIHEQSRAPADARAQLQRLLPKLIALHRYFLRARDPRDSGLISSYHPWESGMDNSPAWDEAMQRVPRIEFEYARRDLQLVDSEQRPTKKEYDRFLYLVDLFRNLGFDDNALRQQCPFQVQDVGFNAVLLRDRDDLLSLCEALDYPDDLPDLREASERTRAAIGELWSAEHRCFLSRDLISGALIPVRTTAGLLPLYARAATTEQADLAAQSLGRWLDAAPFGVASTHPDDATFEAANYWRGPSWLHINWLIALGLQNYGKDDMADRVKRAAAGAIRRSGFREYYRPLDGEGCGGSDFSWTAATALFWRL